MSDTTEFPAGAAPAPGETPLGRPASSGNAGSEGSPAGSTAPATAGSDGAAAVAAKGRRRQGTGLSSLLLPELQQVAQQMGIAGTGRMRKSQLITAIQEKQGGGSAAPARAAKAAAGTASEVSAPRAASAGADVARPAEQEPRTAPETGTRSTRASRTGARSSRTGGTQQLSFDASSTGDGAAPGASSAPAQAPPIQNGQAVQGGQAAQSGQPAAAAEASGDGSRGDGQQNADAPRGERRRRNSNGRDGQQTRSRDGNGRDKQQP